MQLMWMPGAGVDDPAGGAASVDDDPSVDQSDDVLDLLYRGDTEQQRLNRELYMRDARQKRSYNQLFKEDQATVFNTTTNRDQYLDDVIRFRRARNLPITWGQYHPNSRHIG
ncbi:hypothetical protein BC941DRAFT_475929 [Chlamydoabsidia padenii]|nr:hypothetical protein BC941DRAFT_475929 [Chlamydoabsidia padenii]